MDKLLHCSVEYEKIMVNILNYSPYEDSKRTRVSRIMCSVSFEHAESIKILLATHNFTSSLGLLRLQYEALVRSIWIYYAASDVVVKNLASELTTDTARKASNHLPMLNEMLQKMEGKAPKNALDPLLEFKEYSWKPLSSYIHGGIHAIDRHSKGYPTELLVQVLKLSNGLNGMAGYSLAILTGNTELAKNIRNTFYESKFQDCLPEHRVK